MRVLVFTTAFRPMIGGSEIALEEIIRRLPDIFFDIVTPRHKSEFKAFESGSNFNIYRIGPGSGSSKIMFPVLGFFKAVKLMKDQNYDAIHAYQASYGGGAAWLLKLFYPGLNFILTLQEGKSLFYQNFLTRFLRGLIIKRADIVTAISNYLADYAKRINSKANIFLIPNGVDLKKFQIPISNFQSNLNFPNLKQENLKTIITVSRLVPKNGVEDLIDAFYMLTTKADVSIGSPTASRRGYRLLIIGNGPLMKDLRFKIYDLRIQDQVQLLGSIPPDEIPKYLVQADVFVRPSLSEGLGIAFLEAMAAGVPIIGTPVGGIPDFLTNGETGLFCHIGDPEDIAGKMATILFDDELRNKLIIKGRKLVEEKYSWDKIAAEFKNLYNTF